LQLADIATVLNNSIPLARFRGLGAGVRSAGRGRPDRNRLRVDRVPGATGDARRWTVSLAMLRPGPHL